MGYESRIYVLNRKKFDEPIGSWTFYDQYLASFDLSRVNQEVLEVLKANPYINNDGNSDLYTIGDALKKDPYGDIPTMCKATDLYKVMQQMENKEHYRRYKMVLDFLAPLLLSDDWDELIIVHTGY